MAEATRSGDNVPFNGGTLLMVIEVCAMWLPLALWLAQLFRCGTAFPAESISQYYHLAPHSIFVGTMIVVATLLATYEGWKPSPSWRDRLLGLVGAVGATVVALVPTESQHLFQLNDSCSKFTEALAEFHFVPALPQKIAGVSLHFLGAFALFSALAVMCATQFQRSRSLPNRPEQMNWKHVRNGIYLVCAFWMIAPGLIAVVAVKGFGGSLGVAGVFWIETIALFAFGVAWLVH